MKYQHPTKKLPSNLPITKRVHSKLIAIFLIVSILPLFVLGYFSYHKSSQVVNSQFGSYGLYAVQQLKIHLDTNLKQMENITGNILAYFISNPILIEDQEPNTYNQYTQERSFKGFLSSLENMNIVSVNIVTPSGKVMGNDAINSDRLLHSAFWIAYPSKFGNRLFIHRPDYYTSTTVDYVISLIVPIKNQFGLPTGSQILIDMRADTILKLFQSFEHDMKAHLQILDPYRKILLQTSSNYTFADDDILWSEHLDLADWTVEARIPYRQFYKLSAVILKYSLFVAILALIFAIVMAGFFSYRFTRPIKKLTQSMRRFGSGELSIKTPIYTSDELGYLSEAFNRMTAQIKDLFQEISRTEKLKSEAELQVLYSQINPHFLFNTMNSIQWKAKLERQTDIPKMLEHLVAVMEGSFNVKQVLVPLHKELDITHHYLEIQRYRYGDVFTYSLYIEPQLENFLVPRMVFQPILENIFFHGFIDGKGHIELKIISSSTQISVTFIDNGIGIKPEHLKFIANGQKIPDKHGGLGLRNVDERFKLHFGGQYGLTVHSERNKGTEVVIVWPKIVETIL